MNEPAVARAHWGVAVGALPGTAGERPILGLNEEQFFQPASNTKLFTTAAAMALLGGGRTFETRLIGHGGVSGSALDGDLVLVGGGEANLSGRQLPYVPPALRPKVPPNAQPAPEVDPLRYLATMADQVASSGMRVVTGDVVGDDTLFAWEPYPEAWGIDDMVWGYGAPVSALSVGDNELRLTITPSAVAGEAAHVDLRQYVPYYAIEADVQTVPAKSTGIGVQVERAPGSRVLRVYGQIATDAGAEVEQVAVQDPAEYATMALKAMLEARGIEVRGIARARHRAPTETRGFRQIAMQLLPETEPLSGSSGGTAQMQKSAVRSDATGPGQEAGERVFASHVSPPLIDDVVVTNKVSQNLHAELLLHDLGLTRGLDGSTAAGARVVRSFLVEAGVDPEDVVLFDGSGLSGHDLVTPRAVLRLLTWAANQPWFAAWKASLPVGGEDGTLAGRFGKGPLKDHLFAKTGTLGEARALSGYVDCASGRTVAFSVMVTDHAPGGHADQEVMDRIVNEIAAAN